METLFIYIAKSSGLLAVFYFAYYLLLRKETFFTNNRWFLLIGLITSVILPFLKYTRTVWVDPTPISTLNFQPFFIPQTIQKESFEINWSYIILAIYTIGFLIFLIKFAMDFHSLQSILKGKKVQQQADFKFIDTIENIAPFSFFNYIVYNSSLYTATELENIIEHEKVHSDQNHTADVLLSRVFCILFWFNPFIWLYKKAIIQNLEFIADKETAKKLSDKKAYQYTLLKITTHENCVAITNHFYQSLIKKRIIMLNKNQSRKSNSLKYYAVIPALVAFIFLFQVQVVAKEKNHTIKETLKKSKSIDVYKIRKSSTDQELKQIIEKVKSNHNIDVIVSDVERNSNNELTNIKVAIQKGTKEEQKIQIEGDNAINDCGIIITTEENGSQKITLITNNKINDSETLETIKVTEKKTQNSTQTANNDSTSKNDLIKKSIIIVNGTVLPANVSLDDINPAKIESMTVYNSTQAVLKYGNVGGNDVIEIVTKKNNSRD